MSSWTLREAHPHYFKITDHTPLSPLLLFFFALLSLSFTFSFSRIMCHYLRLHVIDLYVMLVSFLSPASENVCLREQGFFVYFVY